MEWIEWTDGWMDKGSVEGWMDGMGCDVWLDGVSAGQTYFINTMHTAELQSSQ